MKKLIFSMLLSAATVTGAFAQKDAAAGKILAQVSQKYRSYDAVKTDFTIGISNPQAGLNETQSGTLITKTKAGKYKLSVYAPGNKTTPAQEIINDGKIQWTYVPKDKEVQVSDADNSASGLNPAQLFNLYQKGYKYLYTGDVKKAGKIYQGIELTPTDPKQTIFKIKLLIDKAKSQIYSAELYDKSGSRYNYNIRSFTPNVPAADNVFTFNPKAHPGVEVVDLR
ncbi:outer membrane lipoprotein carrier protein LolA [Mucilaginibacter sp. Bleaf8]|uniref:LolA family protein n=1 Tax=Mucilaginibacter sp. Bleaf8 TaxID=2834430 RepID=UPI001BCAA1B8|nr:outer membrane lipoprotein carrier protein LolA [Mucilaginibacter sp. Bleaf8]MBS7563471.1 outer membrane lipoprotein carrier protein LolA [Mucilaginibacter sp. Bleaf8]